MDGWFGNRTHYTGRNICTGAQSTTVPEKAKGFQRVLCLWNIDLEAQRTPGNNPEQSMVWNPWGKRLGLIEFRGKSFRPLLFFQSREKYRKPVRQTWPQQE
jgi:hypothetical protein